MINKLAHNLRQNKLDLESPCHSIHQNPFRGPDALSVMVVGTWRTDVVKESCANTRAGEVPDGKSSSCAKVGELPCRHADVWAGYPATSSPSSAARGSRQPSLPAARGPCRRFLLPQQHTVQGPHNLDSPYYALLWSIDILRDASRR